MEYLLQNLEAFLLVLFGIAAVGGAAAMILLRQPMRVAMALIFTMVCLGVIFGLLGVHFIAAFQVLLYVGAVMVFMVYVIMLLEVRDTGAPVYSRWLVPGLVAFGLLVVVVLGSVWASLPPAGGTVGQLTYGISRFSIAFLNEYWLHFELTSVLLVAAVVAAMAVIKVNRKADAAARKARHG
ncbi:NADH-ubiquinone oxidoreductase chain J [Rubrivivax sp. A210]|uniref:NADH-quinone oxidoreductase subunit J family protein n=1 Tax=Rubrivivax sp. A210 TaxID=2772301 RepID=UPI00191AB4E5|nr:NADH-quinone oxidoreductase subunit J [Rubrivivax sp. A210]CAD5375051.1 NADH-ubiquinone oxidoreductase chain J [Rubrivivax sp. A210]